MKISRILEIHLNQLIEQNQVIIYGLDMLHVKVQLSVKADTKIQKWYVF